MLYDALKKYPQFILHRKKKPVDHRTLKIFEKNSGWLKDPNCWTTFNNALTLTSLSGDDYGIGFILTSNDPFFAIDIDSCLEPNNQWSHIANTILNTFPGALVETSISGKGLHIFGSYVGNVPQHGSKNTLQHLEFYHTARYIALGNMKTAIGNAAVDFSNILPSFINTYFPPLITVHDEKWTTEPRPEYTLFSDNDELIKKALSTKSTATKFGKFKATFADLWNNNVDVLSDAYPSQNNIDPYDRSSADASLSQILSFWCGCNCEHILNLMWCSALVRDKWTIHKKYLAMTIKKAVSLQDVVYTAGKIDVDSSIAKQHNAKKLKGSKDQIAWATTIREEKLLACDDNIDLINSLCVKHGPGIQAGFWIDHKDESPQELIKHISPIELTKQPDLTDIKIVEGYQFLPATQQIEHFKGCVYVQDIHKIFTPKGSLLKSEQFNATYGGYVFQLDGEASGKTTKKAFDAFTESQIIRYPIAEKTCFHPELKTGKLIKDEELILVNTYVSINTLKKQGDITLFLNHLDKILPVKNDQEIILAYMAACIQHKGFKFQWCPLIQGAQGNGKTLLTRVVAFCVGERYTHWPFARELTEKFNDWLFDKIFIGVEDIVVADHKSEIFEILKPMISNDRLAKRAMQKGQIMHNVCANFMLNMNSKTGFKTKKDDRRYATFYCMQQSKDDIERDGMGGSYFPNIYNWLRKEGYAFINNYLNNYVIPVELNPALGDAGGLANRAPETSSTDEAHSNAVGAVEQEILANIEEGRQGFSGGWVSSMALERVLQNINAARKIPRNRRREIMQTIGYDWHPSLVEGRTNVRIPLDGGKPRLYIKIDHIHCNLQTIPEIVKAYQDAQSDSIPIIGTNSVYNKFN